MAVIVVDVLQDLSEQAIRFEKRVPYVWMERKATILGSMYVSLQYTNHIQKVVTYCQPENEVIKGGLVCRLIYEEK